MTTIVLVLATIWAGGAILFFAALGLAAKRPMPMPETGDFIEPAAASADSNGAFAAHAPAPSSHPLIATASRC